MKTAIWLLTGMMLVSSALAERVGDIASATGNSAKVQQASNPAVALRAGIDKLMAFLGQDPQPEAEQLAGFLDNEIAPFFDFDYMAKSAGGRLFEQMDVEQQTQITAAIKQSFLGKMADRLAGYSNQQVRFLPPRAGNGGRTAQVSVAILNPGSYPARLDFRLYRSAQQWRVYDVAANGQSAIVHYRGQLMRQVQERRMRQMRSQMPPQALPLRPSPMQGSMPPSPRPNLPPTGFGGPYAR